MFIQTFTIYKVGKKLKVKGFYLKYTVQPKPWKSDCSGHLV